MNVLMRSLRFLTAVALLTTLTASILAAGATSPASTTSAEADPSLWAALVDRIVASVNQDPVLASDVEEAARIEALMRGKPVADIAEADLSAAMDRLIDRTLIRQQMYSLPAASDQPPRNRIAELRASLPAAASDASWKAALAAYGIDEQKLGKYLQDQQEIMRFVDARLRPTADVTFGREIENYYNDKLLPELKQRGAAAVPLRNVQDSIREILLQQKIDAQLSAWLASLREQGRVRILQPRRNPREARAPAEKERHSHPGPAMRMQ